MMVGVVNAEVSELLIEGLWHEKSNRSGPRDLTYT